MNFRLLVTSLTAPNPFASRNYSDVIRSVRSRRSTTSVVFVAINQGPRSRILKAFFKLLQRRPRREGSVREDRFSILLQCLSRRISPTRSGSFVGPSLDPRISRSLIVLAHCQNTWSAERAESNKIPRTRAKEFFNAVHFLGMYLSVMR